MSLIFNITLSLYVGFIVYNLALSFLGIYIPIKQSIFPVFFFTFFIFLSKIVFYAPPIIHTIVLVFFCTLLISLFNKIDIIMSLLSSLLVMMIIILMSLLLVCPLIVKLGFKLTSNFDSIDWLVLNLGELFSPSIIMVINRIKRTSLIKLIIKNEVL